MNTYYLEVIPWVEDPYGQPLMLAPARYLLTEKMIGTLAIGNGGEWTWIGSEPVDPPRTGAPVGRIKYQTRIRANDSPRLLSPTITE